MIVDTSAVLAIYFKEPTALWAAEQMLPAATPSRMSTINLTEPLIRVTERFPTSAAEIHSQLLASNISFVPPDRDQAVLAADARRRFPFNLGDCFAYALAKTLGEPLLTLDRDFRAADVAVVLPEH